MIASATNPAIPTKRVHPEVEKMQDAKYSLMPLPQEIEAQLKERYRFDGVDMSRGSFKWSSSMKRVYCPIFNPSRVMIGGVYRSLDPEAKPKSIIQHDKTEFPCMSCWPNLVDKWKNVLIVEDQFSAIAGHIDDITTVALLGTNASLDKMRMIGDMKPDKVVICLDPDATAKAIAIHKKYEDLFKSCKIVRPDKDLKDMNREQRREFVRRAFA